MPISTRAVDIAIDAKFATSGQDCLAANRIYVQRPILDAFNAAFKARIEALHVGAGLEAGSEIGPLMHARAVAKVEEHVADALARGATLLTGGMRHKAGPLFYTPTLLADVPSEALIMHEETFGPVAAVTAFDTEAEVIARANDTEYGLVAYVVTENGARQMRLGRALEYGMVAINRVKITGSPDSLRRLETIRHRPRRVPSWPRGLHRTQISLHRHRRLKRIDPFPHPKRKTPCPNKATK